MKRGLLLAFLILLIVPFVSATIYTDSGLKDEYNLGSYVKLNGYLVESSDINALLSVNLGCGNETMQLAARSLKITKDKSESFSFDLPITGALTGNCRFLLQLKDFNNTISDSLETTSFDITRSLKGSFDLSSKEFQLGDKLTITGKAVNLNNELIEGYAIVYIKKDGTNYIVDTTGIIGGSLNYETKLISMPAGKYSVDIEVSDVTGNAALFENVLELDLYNELVIAAKSDKLNYLPGEVLILSGNVHKKTGPSVSDTKIKIMFDNQSYTTDIKDGLFLFNIPLSKTIKSYYHDISFEVSDSDGNSGYSETKIEVTPIPTALEANLDKDGYIPEDSINIKVDLYDQAHDILSRPLKIKILDLSNKIVYEDSKLTTDAISYPLPQFAVPGEWKLELESEGLKLNRDVVVEAIELLNIDLIGQTLSVKNMGNEIYSDELEIDSDGVLKKVDVRLKPSESTSIELYKLFDDGVHTINVLGNVFNDVSIIDPRNILEKGVDGLASITGYASMKRYGKVSSTAYLVLLIIALIIILSLITHFAIKLNLKRKPDHIRRKYDNFLGKKSEDIRQVKKYDFKFGKADENDIKDFRKRMMNSIDNERRNSFRLPERNSVNQEKKDDDKGPFSMFK